MREERALLSPRARSLASSLTTRLTISLSLTTLALASSLLEASGAGFDSKFLQGNEKQSPSPSPSPQAKAGPTSRTGVSGIKGQFQADSARGAKPITPEVLASISQILKTATDPVQRNMLLINRSTSYNLYVRQRLLASKDLRVDDFGMKYLQAAVNDANEVANSPKATKDQKQQALYLLGISDVYLDRNHDAREKFIQLLRINPNFKQAGWLALYIGEDYFDAGDYRTAMTYYRNFYRLMAPHSREIALYKIAWCLINMNMNDQAEGVFVRLIRSNSKQGLGRDSIRDLAFLIAHKPDPSGVVQFAEVTFQNVQDRLEFLGYVREVFAANNLVALHTQVVSRMLELETNPEKRLVLLIADLKVHRKLYASREHFRSFQKLEDFLRKSGLTMKSSELAKHETELEGELMFLMRAWVDTFAGRTLTPENLPRTDVATGLKQQFELFLHFIPSSKLKPQVVNLWMDVCLDTKDWSCIDRVADGVAAEPTLYSTLLERASLDQLVALAELEKAEKPPEKDKTGEKRLAKLKIFTETRKNSDQWLRVARTYAEKLAENKQHPEAISVFEQIYAKAPTADNHQRLLYAKFQNGQFKEVIEDSRAPKGATDPRITDLKRESALSLAVEARKKDDLPAYTENIQRFLRLSPDPAKALLARSDYLRYLLDKNNVKQAASELESLSDADRSSQALAPSLLSTWKRSVEAGDFKTALSLLSSHAPKSRGPLNHAVAPQWVLSRLLTGSPPGPQEIDLVDKADREYLVGILTLTRPGTIIDYYEHVAPKARAQQDRDTIELAWRIHTGVWHIERSSRAVKLLGANYSFATKPSLVTLAVEKRYHKVRFPSASMKPALLAKVMGQAATEIQNLRVMVPKQIQGHPPEVQLRALELARDSERKMAQAILESPVPPQLTAEDKINEFKAGLKAAAQEFSDQGDQFEKIAASVREKLSEAKQAAAQRVLDAPQPGTWKWPSSASSAPLSQVLAMAPSNPAGALAYLDFFRPTLLKDDTDYFKFREGILLSGHPSESMRIYVLNELESRKQQSIIDDWRSLVTAPAPKSEGKPEGKSESKPASDPDNEPLPPIPEGDHKS